MYLRDVVEEPHFTQDLDGYRKQYANMDAVHQGITWELSRDPRQGKPFIEAPDYRLYMTTAIGNTPAFWVMYRFDDEKVYLLSLEIVAE